MKLVASVLHLDRQAIKALRITDPYSLHRVVYSLFADVRSSSEKSTSQPSGLLYADQGGDHNGRKILLLSDRAPTPKVDSLYGEVETRVIPDTFLDHKHYRFKVIVNPTRRDSASQKLVPVKGREAVAQWFLERAPSSWGFSASAEHLQIDRIDVLQFKDKNQSEVTMAQAHVQGQLTVTDSEKFHHSFTTGIGRGRAFGCGLLQIVPIIDKPLKNKE